MKFDICVGNPPYGSGRSEIHLQIFKTTLDFCKNQMCFIMPSKPITQQLKKKWMDVFTGAVCTDIDVVDKSVFKGTNMDDTAIYYCDRSANPDDYCKKLDVNDKIYYSFDNDGHRLFIDKLGNFCKNKHLKYRFFINGYYEDCLNTIKSGIQEDKYYLNVNIAGVKPGKGECQWISSVLEKIGILTGEEEVKYCEEHKEVKAIIECPSIKYGENLKNLLINGKVLRYGLWLTQTSQNMNDEVYKYFPDIDYTKITDDESLLKECHLSEIEINKILIYLKDFNFLQNRNKIVRETPVEPDSSPSGSEQSKTVLDN